MISRKWALGFAFLMILSMSACKKYEDGPWFTLRGKKARVVNSWDYQLVLRNGLDVTDGLPDPASIDYSASKIGFNDENRFTTVIQYSDSTAIPNTRFDGTWAFDENEENIILIYDQPAPMELDSQVWRITKLRENELWAEEDFGNNLYEYRLQPGQ
ncbi:MAG: hypothetical protein AAFV80_08060 [Bacteroidota bacterium]